MPTIQNLYSFNSFADASKGDDLLPAATEDYIHIQQRNGKNILTTVHETAGNYDKKKLERVFEKKCAYHSTVTEHPAYKEVIQQQGDQYQTIYQFLTET
ncbi:eukaryotic translation initiation factor 1-like [Cavia porcellus]|uniref:eukaryotic translation initiation factor 1-like n=1 Tax=Cavia porcellus TaxID=10141 RepID=UPI002FE0F6EF